MKQSSSTVKSKLIGFNFRQKSFRIALQIICACGECISDSALFSLQYLKICKRDLYLQLFWYKPLFMLLLFLVSLLCGIISLAVLWLSADAELITVVLPVFSYYCITLLHFRFQLTLHTCYWFNPKICNFWQTADKRVLINIAFQLKYVVSYKSSWDILYIFSSQARGRLLH